MISFYIVTLFALLSSCTYSITFVHTEGTATDVVDETSTNSPATTIDPTISLP